MSLTSSFLQNLEDLIAWVSSHMIGTDLPSYCQLETAVGLDPTEPRALQMAAMDPKGARPYITVTRNCAMLTVFELTGSMDVVGNHEFKQITASLTQSFAAFYQRPGHSVEFSFERDPEIVARKVKSLMQPTYDTAARIGLDLADVLDERAARVSALCADESCYVILYTHLSALAPDELKREVERHRKRMKDHNLQAFAAAQSASAIMKSLLSRHNTYVDTIEKDLLRAKLHVERLSTHDALRSIRQSYDRMRTDSKWKPVLPGDKYTPRMMKSKDGSGMYLMRLQEQMVSSKVETDSDFVVINGQYHGSAYMEVGPQDVQNFATLFERVGRDIPWRIKFTIEPGGLEANKFKTLAVSVIGFMSDTNKAIKRSFDQVAAAVRDENECDVTMRITASTWGKDKESCTDRLSALVSAMQGWGVTQVSTDTGDPIKGLASTIPGFSDSSVAPKMVPLLSDAVSMLPIQRPASPWYAGGSVLLRTLDGKIYPMQPNSSLQTAWIDLIWAIMGSGKSVFLNTLNLGAILSPGLGRLPLLVVVDVGVSSSGLIDLLKSALPDDRKHEVAYVRFKNSPEYAINPLDTLPGCRTPTTFDREYIISLLTALATPAGKTEPFAQSPELAGMIVDEVYAKYAERSGQKRYEPTIDPVVDAALTKVDFELDEFTSWWDVTDKLTACGYAREAMLAQRFAVPVLSDLIEVIGSERIRSVFEPRDDSKAMVDNGMLLLDAMRMVITTALRDFPLIASHTKFEISDQCRVLALDLEEVTKGGTEEAEKRAEIMFVFARQIAARKYYLPEDIKDLAPSIYHDAHRVRYEDIKDEPKGICFDELHRTKGKKSLKKLLSIDRREGRKHGIRVSLASQFLQDFETDGESITESAFSAYIMNAGSPSNRSFAKDLFGLSDSAIEALARDVHGPGKFLAWHQTKSGIVTQVLHNAPGAIELWAFSTTAKDAGLRRRLYKAMPPARARRILAREFPSGSATTYLETRQLQQGGDDENILEIVARELMLKYKDDFPERIAA